MSFRSDVSMPERALDDPRPLGTQQRSRRGDIHARIVARDRRELRDVLRSFRSLYGEAALQAVIDEARQLESLIWTLELLERVARRHGTKNAKDIAVLRARIAELQGQTCDPTIAPPVTSS